MRGAKALIGRARRRAEALMVDECVIRPAVGHTRDELGNVTVEYGAAVYTGKCKIQRFRGQFPSNPVAGEHQHTVSPVELHVPVAGTVAIATGHVVEITASLDAENVGRKFRVRTNDRKSLQSAIRLAVEEVSG